MSGAGGKARCCAMTGLPDMGLKELWESREVLRFALCFSFQPQLVPGFMINKGNKAPDGRRLSGAQGAGPSALSTNSPLETGQLSLRRGRAGRGLTPPTHWTLEEPLCEQDCNPGWRDCFGQVTWAIPWSPWFLPLWPHVSVAALKPCFRLAPCLHPFWVRRHLLGRPRATGTLELPPGSAHLHSIPAPHPSPSPRCILNMSLLGGPAGASPFSSFP